MEWLYLTENCLLILPAHVRLCLQNNLFLPGNVTECDTHVSDSGCFMSFHQLVEKLSTFYGALRWILSETIKIPVHILTF